LEYPVFISMTTNMPLATTVAPNGCTVIVTLVAPGFTYVASTNTTGTIGVSWGASAVAGVTYVLEESSSATFTTSSQVYSGTATTVYLPGHLNGTYYYRVRVTKAGYNDSTWKEATNGCVVTVP
jgi:hypothetical protein